MKLLRIDMTIGGILKTTPYVGASLVYWLTDLGVNIKFLSIFLLLWTFDILSGIIKAIVVKDLRNPESKTGIRRVASKFVMLMFPVVLAAIYSIFTDDAVKMLNWGVMILALHEGYSTLGNFYSIRTGKVLTEFDAVSYSIKSVADWVRRKVEMLTVVMEKGSRDDDWRFEDRRGRHRHDRHNPRGGHDNHGNPDDEEIEQEDTDDNRPG